MLSRNMIFSMLPKQIIQTDLGSKKAVDCFWQIHPPLLISDWCAKLYKQKNYNQEVHGWVKVIQETFIFTLLESNVNDQTSSVRVKPGCVLNLYKNKNKVWLLDSLTADVSDLSAYNDQVSSLSCYCTTALLVSEFLPRGSTKWEDGPSLIAKELNAIYANGLINGCGVKISAKGVSDLETYLLSTYVDYFALPGRSCESLNFCFPA